MENSIMELRSYLVDSANGRGHSQVEELFLSGLKIIHLEKGILRCKFGITENVSRENGIWDAGAIMGVIDVLSFATVYSLSGTVHITLSINSSFYSTAMIHEEVEIEGRVTETKGNLKAVMIEIRKEGNKEVVARGSLWMTPQSHLGYGSRLKDLPPPLGRSSL